MVCALASKMAVTAVAQYLGVPGSIRKTSRMDRSGLAPLMRLSFDVFVGHVVIHVIHELKPSRITTKFDKLLMHL